MSAEKKPLKLLEVDGLVMVVNLLMHSLRRQAAQSLGAKINDRGFILLEDTNVTEVEIQALMLKLAGQGLRDIIFHGMMDVPAIRAFAIDVAKEVAEYQMVILNKTQEDE